MSKCPPGVFRRKATTSYHYRRRIPLDLVAHYGRKEFAYSLGTSSYREACDKARAEAHKLDVEFAEVRNRASGLPAQPVPQLTQAKAEELASKWLQAALVDEERRRTTNTSPRTEEALERAEEVLGGLESDARERLATGEYGNAHEDADEVIRAEGMKLAAQSPEHELLSREMLKARIRFLQVEQRRTWGDYSDKVLPVPATDQPHAQSTRPPSGLRLGEAVSKYIEDKSLSWAASSKKDIVPDLQDFVEMVGDIPVLDLDRDHMRTYHQTMHHLPKRRSQKARYKGKTLAQLLVMDIPEEEKLGAKTLETTFTNVRCLVNWLEAEGLLNRERRAKFLNKMLAVHRQASTIKPSAFTDEELRLLFHPDHFTPALFRSSWNFWLPLLGLFTGARLEELSQLHLSDIRQEEGSGAWYLDINAEGDKQVKTTAGSRKVPLHPGLIELGLLERVTALTKKGEVRLFPHLTARASTGKVSGAAGQWFTRHRRRCGVGAADGEKSPKVFHSFRHTLITKGKYLGLDRRKIKELVGHEQGEFGDVTGGYEGAFTVQDMLEAVVSKLDFGGILDLDRLKGCRWVLEP